MDAMTSGSGTASSSHREGKLTKGQHIQKENKASGNDAYFILFRLATSEPNFKRDIDGDFCQKFKLFPLKSLISFNIGVENLRSRK